MKYWAITLYITASLPGHALFLSTGDTGYFDVFTWWFSLVIMPVYVLIITFFITLRLLDTPASAPKALAV